MLIRPFQESDADAGVALGRLCGLTRPWNDPHLDVVRKLAVRPELFLVGVESGAEAGVERDGWLRRSARLRQ